jgi:hypothetical protein
MFFLELALALDTSGHEAVFIVFEFAQKSEGYVYTSVAQQL